MARPAVRPLPRPHLPRVLRRLRRSPAAWWAAAGATAIVVATQVAALDDDAEARRRAWGEAAEVVVARRDLAAGAVVGATDVALDRRPLAMLPDGALEELPIGRTVAAPIVAGEAVVAARVAPEGLRGVAALVPEGHRGVAVPSAAGGFGTSTPPLAVGDRVDVLATFDVTDGSAGDAAPTGPVARGAVVLDVGDEAVTVAVPEEQAARVAFAVARGTVSLALVGG